MSDSTNNNLSYHQRVVSNNDNRSQSSMSTIQFIAALEAMRLHHLRLLQAPVPPSFSWFDKDNGDNSETVT